MPSEAMPSVTLPSGESIPALGQGTWGWAQRPNRRDDEIDALRTGLDLGLTVVDTAEMYGDGAAEELLGTALRGRRDDAFLVSKVLPHHAGNAVEACHRSLRRLRTDHLDLYLLHWRGPTPLSETVTAFEHLRERGDIRYWGVSNFDVADMEELVEVTSGTGVATDQVLYNLTRRGVEYDLLPWCRDRSVPIMAYSPLEQGRLPESSALGEVAERHGTTASQVALAWLLSAAGVCTVPRASSPSRVRENHAAARLRLSAEDHATLDRVFPPPDQPKPLEVL